MAQVKSLLPRNNAKVERNSLMLLFPETVSRSEYGEWTHSKFPNFGEWVPQKTIDKWGDEQLFDVVIKMLDGDDSVPEDIAEEFFDLKKPYNGFMFWNPEAPSPSAFLLSIHDTEDGPCAWFAVPRHNRPSE